MFRLSLKHRQYLWAYTFLLVPMLFFLGIRIGPTLFAFNMSLHKWNPLAATQPYVGLQNFQTLGAQLADPRSVVRRAFINTFTYVALGVPLQLIIGLSIALLLNQVQRYVSLLRAIYFIPFVTSTVAVAWVWRWLYQPQIGPINLLLAAFALPQQPFLKSPAQALSSIVACAVWQGLGFVVIIFLAGLKQIPRVYYEAARIDGASAPAILRHITLPLLNSTLVYLTVLQSISFLRIFDQVLNMSDQGSGGPLNSTTTVVLRIYREAFGSLNMGYASALTIVLFLIILIITLLQMQFFTRRFEY